MAHPFINNGGTIPKTLALSTLACPPSASYIAYYIELLLFIISLLIRQFLPKATGQQKISTNRFSETTPSNISNGLKSPTNGGASTSNSRPNLVSTDKFFCNNNS